MNICSITLASERYKNSEYSLSGLTINNEPWQIYIDCHFDKADNEIVTGIIELNGVLVANTKPGDMLETSRENIIFFGDNDTEETKIRGWYFESWPRTCSVLPK